MLLCCFSNYHLKCCLPVFFSLPQSVEFLQNAWELFLQCLCFLFLNRKQVHLSVKTITQSSWTFKCRTSWVVFRKYNFKWHSFLNYKKLCYGQFPIKSGRIIAAQEKSIESSLENSDRSFFLNTPSLWKLVCCVILLKIYMNTTLLLHI